MEQNNWENHAQCQSGRLSKNTVCGNVWH